MPKIEKLKAKEQTRPLPRPIVRPCEWGLRRAIMAMEDQVGSIEAYNMLAMYAGELKAKIIEGKAKPQNPYFATDPRNVK